MANLKLVRVDKIKTDQDIRFCSISDIYGGNDGGCPHNNYARQDNQYCSLFEEGLKKRWQRHMAAHELLKSGLEEMDIQFLANEKHRLPMLNAVAPTGLEEGPIRKRLLDEYDIEIGGGLGDYAGKAWRIGLMGESATERHVNKLLSALKEILGR